jgi:hypothetical protein
VLRALLKRVIATYDTPLGGTWHFEDMPEEMIAPRLKAIVAITIDIDRLDGKLKLNQDKSRADRDGVISQLDASADPIAKQTAAAMRAVRGPGKLIRRIRFCGNMQLLRLERRKMRSPVTAFIATEAHFGVQNYEPLGGD